MPELDLVIRAGTVVTAAAAVRCDVGVAGGRVVALGERLGPGAREVDAGGKLVLPGGVDGHCHFDQPTTDGSEMADDFYSGTLSAAFGGTTTVIPFACQVKGRGLREAVDDYHRRAAGKPVILDGFEGAKLICSPPPRGRDNQQVIWNGLESGLFQIFSSDHAPFRYHDPRGKMVRGPDAAFAAVPNGIPGVETRLALLFSEGAGRGRIEITRFAELTAANPARMYGLYPRKGTIAIGADADIVVWDPDRETRISNAMLHHKVDYTPYEGMTIRGWPETVVSRGEIVIEGGELRGAPGRGEFLRCEKPAPARPKVRADAI